MSTSIRLNEPTQCNYIYIEPKTNRVHLLLPIVGGETIGRDNTCKTVYALKEFLYGMPERSDSTGIIPAKKSALVLLKEYAKALSKDIKLLNGGTLSELKRLKEERLIQIQQYIGHLEGVVSDRNLSNAFTNTEYPTYPQEIKELLKKTTNIHSILLSPSSQDDFLNGQNRVFSLDRAVWFGRLHENPRLQTNLLNRGWKWDSVHQNYLYNPNSLSIQLRGMRANSWQRPNSKSSFIKFCNLGNFQYKPINNQQKFEALLDWIEQKLTEKYGDEFSLGSFPPFEAFIDKYFLDKDDSKAEDLVDYILLAFDDSFWQSKASIFDNLGLTKHIQNPNEEQSIKVQFYLAQINLYCFTNNISRENFGRFLDTKNVSKEFTKGLNEAFEKRLEIESFCIEFINKNKRIFGLNRELLLEDKQKINRRFKIDFTTVKESEHFDEFVTFSSEAKGGGFFHRGCIAVHYTDFAQQWSQSRNLPRPVQLPKNTISPKNNHLPSENLTEISFSPFFFGELERDECFNFISRRVSETEYGFERLNKHQLALIAHHCRFDEIKKELLKRLPRDKKALFLEKMTEAADKSAADISLEDFKLPEQLWVLIKSYPALYQKSLNEEKGTLFESMKDKLSEKLQSKIYFFEKKERLNLSEINLEDIESKLTNLIINYENKRKGFRVRLIRSRDRNLQLKEIKQLKKLISTTKVELENVDNKFIRYNFCKDLLTKLYSIKEKLQIEKNNVKSTLLEELDNALRGLTNLGLTESTKDWFLNEDEYLNLAKREYLSSIDFPVDAREAVLQLRHRWWEDLDKLKLLKTFPTSYHSEEAIAFFNKEDFSVHDLVLLRALKASEFHPDLNLTELRKAQVKRENLAKIEAFQLQVPKFSVIYQRLKTLDVELLDSFFSMELLIFLDSLDLKFLSNEWVAQINECLKEDSGFNKDRQLALLYKSQFDENLAENSFDFTNLEENAANYKSMQFFSSSKPLLEVLPAVWWQKKYLPIVEKLTRFKDISPIVTFLIKTSPKEISSEMISGLEFCRLTNKYEELCLEKLKVIAKEYKAYQFKKSKLSESLQSLPVEIILLLSNKCFEGFLNQGYHYLNKLPIDFFTEENIITLNAWVDQGKRLNEKVIQKINHQFNEGEDFLLETLLTSCNTPIRKPLSAHFFPAFSSANQPVSQRHDVPESLQNTKLIEEFKNEYLTQYNKDKSRQCGVVYGEFIKKDKDGTLKVVDDLDLKKIIAHGLNQTTFFGSKNRTYQVLENLKWLNKDGSFKGLKVLRSNP